jgi:putative glycosyltransferase
MTVELSIVTTLYNSAGTIVEFLRRSAAAAAQITPSFEIVVVDDGSPDDSLNIVLGLLASEPRVKVVELSRNFGHHAAMMTGLMHADGRYVFLIDSDLEESPELLLEFWKKLQATDMDVVYGYQKERRGDFGRRVFGRMAYAVFEALLPVKIPLNHITVRLMRRPYVDALLQHRERETAIGGLWVITGFRQIGHEVDKGARRRGSYSFRHRWHSLIDSVTSFSEVPLVGIFYLGIFISAVAALAAAGLIVRRLLGVMGEGWASLMVSLWFIGGLLIFCVGLIGIYVSKIFIETKQRPYTIVRQIHRHAGRPTASYAHTDRTR